MTFISSTLVVDGSGTLPAFSNSAPFVHQQREIAAVVEQEVRAWPPLKAEIWVSMLAQYSGRVSPFHANTGTPALAMAAAASSWVE